MSKLRFILILLFITNSSFSEEFLKFKKVIADAVMVDNVLSDLEKINANHSFITFRKDINAQLDLLKKAKTGFQLNEHPITLNVDANNRKEVENVFVNLHAILTKIRMATKKRAFTFSANEQVILLTLLSENTGDYFTVVHSSFIYKLYNHPLRKEQEIIEFKGVDFAEISAVKDTSLWNITNYCSNLKFVSMLAAEITDNTLSRLRFNRIHSLQALNLAENKISALPVDFNERNTLKYLNLSKNEITVLPKRIGEWNQLLYLDLQQNLLAKEEKERISKALPNTEIKF